MKVRNKTDIPEISDKVKNFLDTSEGKRFFRKITPNMSKQKRYDFKKSFIDPPHNVRRWLTALRLIEDEINL